MSATSMTALLRCKILVKGLSNFGLVSRITFLSSINASTTVVEPKQISISFSIIK